jgi:hypothetical protein
VPAHNWVLRLPVLMMRALLPLLVLLLQLEQHLLLLLAVFVMNIRKLLLKLICSLF